MPSPALLAGDRRSAIPLTGDPRRATAARSPRRGPAPWAPGTRAPPCRGDRGGAAPRDRPAGARRGGRRRPDPPLDGDRDGRPPHPAPPDATCGCAPPGTKTGRGPPRVADAVRIGPRRTCRSASRPSNPHPAGVSGADAAWIMPSTPIPEPPAHRPPPPGADLTVVAHRRPPPGADPRGRAAPSTASPDRSWRPRPPPIAPPRHIDDPLPDLHRRAPPFQPTPPTPPGPAPGLPSGRRPPPTPARGRFRRRRPPPTAPRGVIRPAPSADDRPSTHDPARSAGATPRPGSIAVGGAHRDRPWPARAAGLER